MQMVKINAKVKEETLNALKDEAEKDGRTESGMIRKILEDYFKDNEFGTVTFPGIKFDPKMLDDKTFSVIR